MAFHADLHIHSKYSRATSRDLDLEHLAWWAGRKGIAVVGTGDCVHPVWLAELKDKLAPTGGGLFRLKPEIECEIWKTLPPACRMPVSFMLSTEISTIYKKGDRTRKIHHLIYTPDFEATDRLAAALARIGNIASDGRPILGLDSRDLLEIALESGPHSYLVPAHIWTPWFAALGSQSGFDSIAECYGDLAGHIFAVETGLSSDPAMNWRVSFLDRYRLTSNSDAHSPGKLGREATRFSCDADYFSIRRALETGEGYVGTVEFFPEEGKYHMDGHRACGVGLNPRETIAHQGICPSCGRPLTIGVAHRVEALADRAEDKVSPPPTAGDVASLVPLPEILSEIVGTGVSSKGVARAYERAVAALGPELSVLQETPVEDVARADPLLGEAVRRLRAGTVIRKAGYDGEYGVIRLFEEDERARFTRGDLLFDAPVSRRARAAKPAARETAPERAEAAAPASPAPSGRSGILATLDADQARAAEMVDGPVAVLAGPGSGKTRMLTHRLAHLVMECGMPASSCLAITFTRRATEEMRERLAALLPAEAGECVVHSFHSLGLAILRAEGAALGLRPDFRIADAGERTAALAGELQVSEGKASRLLKAVSALKRTGALAHGEAADALAACQRLWHERNWVDFDDLVGLPVELFETRADILACWQGRFRTISADEFQDVDEQQYRLLRLLAGADGNLCVIGDPNQAIYGFRGADSACFERFAKDFPAARTVRLARNYRSSGTIVSAAAQIIRGDTPTGMTRPMLEPVTIHAAASEQAEAAFVAATIEDLMGGHDLLTTNSGRAAERRKTAWQLGFCDFAILYRTDAQAAALREALDRAGIPFRKSSPAPIAGNAAVRALLAALCKQGERSRVDDLTQRIAEAAEQIRLATDAPDTASLAEARRWLTALVPRAEEDETRLCEQAALATEADFHDLRADRVSLLTMHAAKGLEFPVVFIVGCEDGLTPFSWGSSSDGGVTDQEEKSVAEERRLFYVAVTRARDRLVMTRAAERTWRGQARSLPPSRFVRDIAPALTAEISRAPRKTRPERLQLSLF